MQGHSLSSGEMPTVGVSVGQWSGSVPSSASQRTGLALDRMSIGEMRSHDSTYYNQPQHSTAGSAQLGTARHNNINTTRWNNLLEFTRKRFLGKLH